MKILITGYGSIGKRHFDNLRKIGVELMLYRTKKGDGIDDTEIYFDLDKALAQGPDAVFITNPTSLHIETAIKAAEAGCNLFIEKPLSHNMDGVDELIDLIKRKNLIAMVGYNMRFHPGLKMVRDFLDKEEIGRVITARIEVGSYLPDWHPDMDYRRSYSALKEMGGGAILDLSHEIDYLRWLLGEVTGILCLSGRVSDLEIGTEDVAEMVLRLDSGSIAGIHLDYLQRYPSRSCEIIGESGTLVWDGEKRVKLFSVKDKKWRVFEVEEDRSQTYIDEVEHFIGCIKSGEKPIINEMDGKRVVEIAMAAKRSAETGELIELR